MSSAKTGQFECVKNGRFRTRPFAYVFLAARFRAAPGNGGEMHALLASLRTCTTTTFTDAAARAHYDLWKPFLMTGIARMSSNG